MDTWVIPRPWNACPLAPDCLLVFTPMGAIGCPIKSVACLDWVSRQICSSNRQFNINSTSIQQSI
ncbi:MAG: hypothetical protein MUF72_08895 [Elainella sp. Prado103]|nr:hypothetical protein [Elainella sp. Prado103]